MVEPFLLLRLQDAAVCGGGVTPTTSSPNLARIVDTRDATRCASRDRAPKPVPYMPDQDVAMALLEFGSMSNSPVRLEMTQPRPGSFVVVGEIDAQSAAMISERLDPLPEGSDDVEIDLSSVSFIDSSGLRALIEIHDRAEESSRRLVLRSPSQSVTRLLDIAGLAGHFHTVP